MNRSERRERERQQAKSAAALRKRADRTITAKEALDVCQRLFQFGRSKDALPGLLQAVAAYPDDPDLRGALAYALASTGQAMKAIEQYRVLLDKTPDVVPVLTNLALLLRRTGNLDEAQERLARASELAPEHANTAFALAELLAGQKRIPEALHHYRRAARLFQQKIGADPQIEHCDDLVKLAMAQLWVGDTGPALRNLDLAVELRPNHVLALARRGMALIKLRRIPAAIASLTRAAAAAPSFAELRVALGEVLRDKGELEGAQRQFEAALRIDPGDEVVRYLLAVVKHESPEAPPPAYVVNLFDGYAQTFEHHLVDVLQYRAPEQVCGAVLALAGAQAADWQVIDLGCGTGLNGPLIRHAARHLIGVDLSVAMLEKARAKDVYDELAQGDVVHVLGGYADAFDLALCTDVMIYLGSLAPIFAAAARALKPGALFAFTTESHSGEGFVVDASARYLHSRGYVESEAASHGLAVVHFDTIVARYQGGKPDLHNLFIVRRQVAAGG